MQKKNSRISTTKNSKTGKNTALTGQTKKPSIAKSSSKSSRTSVPVKKEIIKKNAKPKLKINTKPTGHGNQYTNEINDDNINPLTPFAQAGKDYEPKRGALQINHITKIYSKKTVVNDVSFEVNQGEVVGLLGPNGAGKTTSFYVAVGLVRPEKGKVMFDGKNIISYPMHKRSYLGIGYLPQEASIFRKLSVYNNVMCILEARKYPKHKRVARVKQILEQLHVSHVANQYGYTLSGGERRRVEIARSLACDPKIILLDEPFAGVDPIAVKDIQTVIQEIQKMNIGILITDHNVRETLKIVSRAYIMSEGSVILQGTAKELVRSKKAREIYLGDDFQL